jgi:TRAP transporter 4TM/12TM fusion protein
VTLAGYLLGAVSGSGVANTVMLGSVSWPMMQRAGYPPDTAGAILAASGIGAILAPPVMGAAAFLIAQFLDVSYFDVVRMAALPTVLYYAAVVVTVEADSRRMGLRPADLAAGPFLAVTRRGWYYFLSILAIFAFMARGATAFTAVFWATIIAAGASVLSREHALSPRRLAAALSAGGQRVVPVVATTAAAGIIVGVVTLTGLGLKAAGLIVMLAGDSRLLTAIYAAVAVWLLGLAMPVTASYIIAAVMVAPALTAVGVSAAAAHMFIFYYAVLSEVSPPTALSPFAAAAITGGRPFRTTMMTWKYTIPAFLVPFVFTVKDSGDALLLQGSAGATLTVALATLVGIVAIAMGAGGYLWRRPATAVERGLAIAAGLAVLILA